MSAEIQIDANYKQLRLETVSLGGDNDKLCVCCDGDEWVSVAAGRKKKQQ